jgi:hypothetical protein
MGKEAGMDTVVLEDGRAEVGVIQISDPRRIRVLLERGENFCLTWLGSAEARALAALLLKHADRVEGKT